MHYSDIFQLGKDLVYASVVGTIIFLVTAFIAIYGIDKSNSIVQRLYSHPFTVSKAALTGNELALRFQHLLSNNVAPVHQRKLNAEELSKAFEETSKSIIDSHLLISQYYLGPREDIIQAKSQFSIWQSQVNNALHLIDHHDNQEALLLVHSELSDALTNFIESNNVFVRFATQKANDFRSEASSQFDQLSLHLFTLFALTLIAVAVTLLFVIRSITLPLKQVVIRAQKLGEQDFSLNTEIQGYDELAELEIALNQTSLQLGQLIGDIEERSSELDRMNTQLQESLEFVEQSNDKLVHSEKMAALGELVAGVAHEINTPLGVAVTAFSMVESETEELSHSVNNKTLTNAKMQKYLHTMNECAEITAKNLKKAAALIANFKMVAVDQAGEEERTINLMQYINEAVNLLHPLYKNLELTINIRGNENIELITRPGVWNQIITNLISNSVIHGYSDALPEMFAIDINLDIENRDIVLSYSDNGVGIPADIQDKVFDPFFTTRRGNGGSGLGMSIVYNLVQSHLKGTIELIHQNRGVKFILHIPAVRVISS